MEWRAIENVSSQKMNKYAFWGNDSGGILENGLQGDNTGEKETCGETIAEVYIRHVTACIWQVMTFLIACAFVSDILNTNVIYPRFL